jgi:hypothetical protein
MRTTGLSLTTFKRLRGIYHETYANRALDFDSLNVSAILANYLLN